MHIALLLADGRPGLAARAAQAHVRHLRARGHRADLVLLHDDQRRSCPGHTAHPDGTLTLAQATARYDVACATSWRSWYAMFGLDARAHASLIVRDELAQAGPARALVERSLREPGLARAVVRPDLGVDDAELARLGVDAAQFFPERRAGTPRVLLVGDGLATQRAASALPRGVERWHLGSGRLGRRVGPIPLDAMPALLRSCHVLVDAEPGSGLLVLEMRATGGEVVAGDAQRGESNAGNSWEEGCRRLEGVLEAAQPLPAWRCAELRAIHELLDRKAARVDAPAVLRALADRGRWLARRVVWRWQRPAASRPAWVPPPSWSRSSGPADRVLFAGRPSYFRSVYFDAVRAGWGVEAPVGDDYQVALAALPELADRTGARTCVVFAPELLGHVPDAAAALRARGVRLVGYSTEPVPQDGSRAVHWDQLRRLDNLRPARRVQWDLFLHFDPASLETLRREGFGPLRAQPLPVSEALFYPEDVPVDIDVCFLGRSTPHREAFLHQVEFRHHTVHVAHGLFDEDARRLMNRSRLVVNLHAHDYPSFENRCVQALFCGRPLASEPLSNDLLTPGVDFLVARRPSELAAHAAAVLAGRAPLPSPRFDRGRFLVGALRDALAEVRP